MDLLLPPLALLPLLGAALSAMTAGLIKGMTGFGMPMIMISGLSLFLPPDIALAGLILPTVVTNGLQALREGWRAAWESIKKVRVYLAILLIMIAGSAQLVTVLSTRAMFLMIGVPVTLFALLQLSGWQPRLRAGDRRPEVVIGGVSGFFGGLSGIWGPPTVLYLTAIDMPKAEHVRVQGVIYGCGAVALLAAHLQSGVLRAETAALSVWMILPAVAGLMLGRQVLDRIDQVVFRRIVLIVLVVAGLNLVRRGLMG